MLSVTVAYCPNVTVVGVGVKIDHELLRLAAIMAGVQYCVMAFFEELFNKIKLTTMS